MKQFTFYGWIAIILSPVILLLSISDLTQHVITGDQLRVDILLFLAVQLLARIEAKNS